MSKRRNRAAPTVSFRTLFDHWWRHHKLSASTSFARQRHQPLQHLLIALVIGVALALPALLMIAIENVRELGQRWDGTPTVSVFAELKATDAEQQQLREQLAAMPLVTAADLLPPVQALADMEQSMGISGTEALLGHNPLPALITVRLSAEATEADIARLLEQWRALDRVDKVEADLAWVRKLFQIIVVFERIALLLALLLGLGALLSVGSMIRLAVESRRDEIMIASLVGATDAFVRRPFLYSGFWYGLSGGMVALLLLLVGYFSAAAPVSALLTLYQTDFQLQRPDALGVIGLLGTGIGLGIVGAWLAVSQQLHEMRPR